MSVSRLHGSRLMLAWRWFRRDLAAGELTVLLAALVLAVTATAAVGFLTDRAQRALGLEANRLLGGDALLRADQPIDPALSAWALDRGLAVTQTLSFRSMLRAGEDFRLAEVRALAPGFPLRGAFRLVDEPGGEERTASGVPERGTLWLTRAGAEQLGLAVGAELGLGRSRFRLAALVTAEPDAAMDYFNTAPRVFLHLDDLDATGLVQEGSRIGYRLVVAGAPAAVEAFVAHTRDRLGRGQRLETVRDARPEIRSALDRAERFLGLSALVAVVLAAIAVAMGARRHAARHRDVCAMLRCLGASQRDILAMYAGELLLLGTVGAASGVGLALALQALVGDGLGTALGLALPPAGWKPALQGFGVAYAMLAGFALPQVLALRRVPPLRVLRHDVVAPTPGAAASAAAGLGALAALIAAQAGSATLAGIVLGGLAVTFAVLAALAGALVVAVRAARGRLRGAWRFGVANLARHPAASVAQAVALGLGLTVMLLLTLVRTDLVARWQAALPPDAPNRFLLNVQRDQVDGVRALLAEHGLAAPELFPMVRARLVSRNGTPVRGADFTEDRARRLAEREFNLSETPALRDDNTVVAGRFWEPAAADTAQLSVETGLAEALGWSLGDRIGFDIAGRSWEATVTSLREVEWESFRPNFFVVAPPGAFDGYAASHITSFHLPPERRGAVRALLDRFPNLSVIDVEAALRQVQRTADQVATAVEYVFGFSLIAGILVLFAAIGASQDERRLDGAVMRALGARRRQLRLAHVSEFVALGLVAGLTAAVAASALAGLLATRVFELPWTPDWRVPLAGAALGVVLVAGFGLLATRRIAADPPAATLRRLAG